MTRMLDSLAARPAPQRIVIALLLSIVGLFLAGLAVGVVAAGISHGHLPKRIWVLAIPFVAAPAAFLSLKTAWRLVLPAQSASAYEKRYWRMWMWVMALGVPVGIVYGFTTLGGDEASFEPFSNTPISAPAAVFLATIATGFAAFGLYLYHRTIDDHEERAYLWGSQLALFPDRRFPRLVAAATRRDRRPDLHRRCGRRDPDLVRGPGRGLGVAEIPLRFR